MGAAGFEPATSHDDGALGQVLRYADLLGDDERPVQKIIAVERQPTDDSWSRLCEAKGVVLVWPGTFETLFASER